MHSRDSISRISLEVLLVDPLGQMALRNCVVIFVVFVVVSFARSRRGVVAGRRRDSMQLLRNLNK